MKKVKVMLLSLAMLAVVGGALAFKAKYSDDFCYTTAHIVNGAYTCVVSNVKLKCPTFTDISTIDAVGPLTSCTTTPFEGGCSEDLTCLTPRTSLIGN
jgi:hypothetical protein